MRTAASADLLSADPCDDGARGDAGVRLQLELRRLLAHQVDLFTLGESSSVALIDAARLTSSVCYVLDIDPADIGCEQAARMLSDGLQGSFDRGVRRLEDEARRIPQLWKEVCLAAPLLPSIALRDTLESLKEFSVRYEPRFFAHEIPADIDYPLNSPVSSLREGADYVMEYLEKLKVECLFVRRFDRARCASVLETVHPAYGELIINLFEPIAAKAIACTLADRDVSALYLGKEGFAELAHVLGEAPRSHREALLHQAADRVASSCAPMLCRELYARRLREELDAVVSSLAARLDCALRNDTLEGLFPESR